MKDIFLELERHPLGMIKKDFKKLKKDEMELSLRFIEENSHLDRNDFEFKLNRLFLDKENNKPKNWKIILQLLSMTNSRRG